MLLGYTPILKRKGIGDYWKNNPVVISQIKGSGIVRKINQGLSQVVIYREKVRQVIN